MSNFLDFLESGCGSSFWFLLVNPLLGFVLMLVTSVCTTDPWIVSQVTDDWEIGELAHGKDSKDNFRLFSGRKHS